MSKIWKKILRAKTLLMNFRIFQKRYVRITFRLQSTGKKVASFKIPVDEYELILIFSRFENQSPEEFILESVKDYVYR